MYLGLVEVQQWVGLRKNGAIWPGIIQQPVNAGSRRIGVKTARLGVDQCFPTFFSSRPTFNASFIVRPTVRYDQTFATHF